VWEYNVALSDTYAGLINWRMWGRMGWQETKRRYRRTVIGPFWTTLSLGIFIMALGFVWANLWNQDPKVYLPYLSSGFVVWVFVAAIINEGCSTFIAAESIIKQLRFPYSIFSFTVVWRNLIVFFHNLVIYFFVCIYANVSITWYTLLAIPALIVIFVNGVWVATVLGLLCSRFRDIQQVIASILQISMFVTPILWSAEQLGERFNIIVDFNILYHYLDILRSPLLGRPPSSLSWAVTLSGTVIGWVLMIFLYSRFRKRIPYWL